MFIGEAMVRPPICHAFTMVGKSFGIPTILFYLASDANKNKRVGDLNRISPTYDMVAYVRIFFKRALC